MNTILPKPLGGLLLASALAVSTAHAGFFMGEFAPSHWTFSGPPSDIVWDPAPPAAPSSVTVYAPKLENSISTLQLNPVSGLYTVSFRTTFNAMSAPTASLMMNAPGYIGENLGTYPGDTMPTVKNFTFTMGPGDTIDFLMTADTTAIGDKKNVPFFTVDNWEVQAVPEPGQWAMMGLTAIGVVSYAIRHRRAQPTR